MDCITAICPCILTDQFKKKETLNNKYLPLLLGCKSRVRCHTYPVVSVVFPPLLKQRAVLLNETY